MYFFVVVVQSEFSQNKFIFTEIPFANNLNSLTCEYTEGFFEGVLIHNSSFVEENNWKKLIHVKKLAQLGRGKKKEYFLTSRGVRFYECVKKYGSPFIFEGCLTNIQPLRNDQRKASSGISHIMHGCPEVKKQEFLVQREEILLNTCIIKKKILQGYLLYKP